MSHAGSMAKGAALTTLNDPDVSAYVRADGGLDDAVLVAWMAKHLRALYGDVRLVSEGRARGRLEVSRPRKRPKARMRRRDRSRKQRAAQGSASAQSRVMLSLTSAISAQDAWWPCARSLRTCVAAPSGYEATSSLHVAHALTGVSTAKVPSSLRNGLVQLTSKSRIRLAARVRSLAASGLTTRRACSPSTGPSVAPKVPRSARATGSAVTVSKLVQSPK